MSMGKEDYWLLSSRNYWHLVGMDIPKNPLTQRSQVSLSDMNFIISVSCTSYYTSQGHKLSFIYIRGSPVFVPVFQTIPGGCSGSPQIPRRNTSSSSLQVVSSLTNQQVEMIVRPLHFISTPEGWESSCSQLWGCVSFTQSSFLHFS